MCVTYLRLIILSVVDDISVDSEMLLMTDFVNLKIKSAHFFKSDHMMYVRVFIEECLYVYKYLRLYCVPK
jgi:hypothetical protein